jgi:hypothetical protein
LNGRAAGAGHPNCAIWENETQANATTRMASKASVDRRYKDREGHWKSSQSSGRDGKEDGEEEVVM